MAYNYSKEKKKWEAWKEQEDTSCSKQWPAIQMYAVYC